jgi:predicted HTH domain antitoxin
MTSRASGCGDVDQAEKDVRLAVAIEGYQRGAISQERAAEIAGLSRADFIDELAARKIDVIQVDLEELKREIGLGGVLATLWAAKTACRSSPAKFLC